MAGEVATPEMWKYATFAGHFFYEKRHPQLLVQLHGRPADVMLTGRIPF